MSKQRTHVKTSLKFQYLLSKPQQIHNKTYMIRKNRSKKINVELEHFYFWISLYVLFQFCNDLSRYTKFVIDQVKIKRLLTPTKISIGSTIFSGKCTTIEMINFPIIQRYWPRISNSTNFYIFELGLGILNKIFYADCCSNNFTIFIQLLDLNWTKFSACINPTHFSFSKSQSFKDKRGVVQNLKLSREWNIFGMIILHRDSPLWRYLSYLVISPWSDNQEMNYLKNFEI